MRRTTLALMLLPALLCPALPGQQPVDWNQQIQQRSFIGNMATQDYRLGPNDLIEVTVYGIDKFSQAVRISLSGLVNIPLLGMVQAAGLTGAELEKSIAALLVENKLVLSPQVSVFIKEYRSQPVLVLGAVKSPGQYVITQPLKILDMLAMAGGLDLSKSADYVFLHRRRERTVPEGKPADPPTQASGNSDAVKIDLRPIIEGSDLSQNLPVQGGDVIQVPELKPKIIYIVGDVGRAGVYQLPRGNENIRITQALAWAGGAAKTAKQSKGILVRYDDTGNRVEKPVDYAAIMKGKQPDFLVQENDVIFIPGSNIKTLGYGLLNQLPSAASSAVYGGIVY